MKNNIKRLLLILFFLSGIFFILKPLFLGVRPDFYVYYTATKAFIAGKNIYLASTGTSFIYPPFALFFILPFALFPYTLAQTLWTAVSIIFFFISVLLLLKMENEKLYSNRFLLFTGVLLYSFPAKFTLGMGQINMVILLLTTFFLYFYKKTELRKASGFLSLSLNTKFFPFFFFFVFLAKKQWRILFYLAGFSLGFFLASLFIFRTASMSQFITHILPGIINSTRNDYYNQSLSGFIFRLVLPTTLSETIIRVCSLVFFLITAYVVWKSDKKQLPLVFGLLICLHLLIDSFSWQHYFVWLFIPYVQLMYTLLRKNVRIIMYIPIILSYFLTQSNLSHPYSFPILLQSHAFYGTLILWGYILYILNQNDKHTLSY